ncbi:carbohydrate-binding module family 63 protein [Melanomma pulvis-pyrius CBS 109.77]|uniref:Carbohydrate-binding module family 63 protein n=1 Tax=Melanomma pulvis-pyrius CBS 109.77 TaxID=1314802 RepID=A0A6A6WYI4_9PLEO|nr:carbohydrate-binding module family 63 protein [Melanomma pulvis-pyrius CBS 109.77]
MKSILSVLPFVGFAIAQKGCTQEIVTVTDTQTYTVTVPAVTAFEADASTVIVDTTTTLTITLQPSHGPYYPLPNGTHNAPRPSTYASVSLVYVSPSPVASEAAPTSEYVIYVSPSPVAEAAPTSEYIATSAPAAVPTAEAEAPVAATSPNVAAAALTGEATTYGGNVDGGMCSFTGYTIPSGIFGTALSDSNWAGAGSCGACVSVKGPSGKSITAMVVDQCPGCGNNHLDLFPDAYAKLAPTPGIIPVSWSFVSCGITSPIQLKNKEGTSKYWFSMQVRNSNVRVAKLDVSTDGGVTWKATTRKDYNFFENPSGFGTDTVDVKITSVDGKTITVKSVSIAPNTVKAAASNFA